MTKVKIINNSKHPLPQYSTKGAACFDIRANIEEEIILPGQRECSKTIHQGNKVNSNITAIPTGLFVEIPEGYAIDILPRSGLALKSGISVLNSPGKIDEDFRGQIQIIIANLGSDYFTIKDGDRIAQGQIVKVEKAEWVEVETLEETERGTGGFGSTGKA